MPATPTIEIFKTDVQDDRQCRQIISLLLHHFPGSKISIDMEDCDRVLRIEGVCCPVKTIELVQQNGFSCSELQ